jgi:hypothetical protein
MILVSLKSGFRCMFRCRSPSWMMKVLVDDAHALWWSIRLVSHCQWCYEHLMLLAAELLWVVMLFAFYVAFSFLCLLSFVMQDLIAIYFAYFYLAYLFLFMHNLSTTELSFSAWSEHKFMLSSSIFVTCSYFSELRSFRFHIVSLVCCVKRLQKYLSLSMLLFYLKPDLSTT